MCASSKCCKCAQQRRSRPAEHFIMCRQWQLTRVVATQAMAAPSRTQKGSCLSLHQGIPSTCISSASRMIWLHTCTLVQCWRTPLQLGDRFLVTGRARSPLQQPLMFSICAVLCPTGCAIARREDAPGKPQMELSTVPLCAKDCSPQSCTREAYSASCARSRTPTARCGLHTTTHGCSCVLQTPSWWPCMRVQ
jgi:hypothetical protein